MICDKCKNIMCMNAFTTTVCEKCGKEIVIGHIPGYKVCIECSDNLELCQQCSESINSDE